VRQDKLLHSLYSPQSISHPTKKHSGSRPTIIMPAAAAAAAVVKATDLVPKAFNGTAAVHEEKPDDLLYDLHHLAAVDSHPVSFNVWGVCGPAAF